MITGGGLLVWFTLVVIICMFFKGAKKLNDKWDAEHEEHVRRMRDPYGVRRG